MTEKFATFDSIPEKIATKQRRVLYIDYGDNFQPSYIIITNHYIMYYSVTDCVTIFCH